jgi:hypothetical protein
MGAYYIDPKNIRDMHVALTEIAHLPAPIHTDWDALLEHRHSPAIGEIPVMQGAPARDQGTRSPSSATPAMLIVQNSWVRAGVAAAFRTAYGGQCDGLLVVQMGAITADTNASRARPRRTDPAGNAFVS